MIYYKKGSLSPRMIYIEKTLSMFGVIWIFFSSIEVSRCFFNVPPPSQLYRVERED